LARLGGDAAREAAILDAALEGEVAANIAEELARLRRPRLTSEEQEREELAELRKLAQEKGWQGDAGPSEAEVAARLVGGDRVSPDHPAAGPRDPEPEPGEK
jgi:hypothetical protein